MLVVAIQWEWLKHCSVMAYLLYDAVAIVSHLLLLIKTGIFSSHIDIVLSNGGRQQLLLIDLNLLQT